MRDRARKAVGWRSGVVAAMLAATPATRALADPPPQTRPARPLVLSNHVGYTPWAAKWVVSQAPGRFQLLDGSLNPVFEGELTRGGDAFGTFFVGQFSVFDKPGQYVLRVGDAQSHPLGIGPDIYRKPVELILGYLRKTRCGDSKTGWMAPCHTDDGRRKDTGRHQDTSGGWHDACDFMKWTGNEMLVTAALLNARDGVGKLWGKELQEQVTQEALWGVDWLLKVPDPEGGWVSGWMAGVNKATDNKVGTEDDRPSFIDGPSIGLTLSYAAEMHRFAELLKPVDAARSERCRKAAAKAAAWAMARIAEGRQKEKAGGGEFMVRAGDLAGLIGPLVGLHSATGQHNYADLALDASDRLLALQQVEPLDDRMKVHGFFCRPKNKGNWNDISCANRSGEAIVSALCALLDAYPTYPQAKRWKTALQAYLDGYLLLLGRQNAFDYPPHALYGSPVGPRHLDGKDFVCYRFFMTKDTAIERADRMGDNARLAATGLSCLGASRVLADRKATLIGLAQRQLDWILGANPLDICTMEGVGCNVPQRHNPGVIPQLPGAVMTGLRGTPEDQPSQSWPNAWDVSEYWLRSTANVLTLMVELSVPPQ